MMSGVRVSRRQTVVGVLAGAGLCLATIGGLHTVAAWACVPQPLVTLSPQGFGPAGSQVTVNAVSVAGEVEIRWNALDGPKLGGGPGPALSTAITIPQSDPGLYTILVLERRPDGSAGSTGRAEFLVTGADGTAGAAGAAGAGRGRPEGGRSARSGGADQKGHDALLAPGVFALTALGGAAGYALGRRGHTAADRPLPA